MPTINPLRILRSISFEAASIGSLLILPLALAKPALACQYPFCHGEATVSGEFNPGSPKEMEQIVNSIDWNWLGAPGKFLNLSNCKWAKRVSGQYGCFSGYFRTDTPMGIEVCELTHVSMISRNGHTSFWMRNSKDTPDEECRWR